MVRANETLPSIQRCYENKSAHSFLLHGNIADVVLDTHGEYTTLTCQLEECVIAHKKGYRTTTG